MNGIPHCVACEDNPKAPNIPCAVCGKDDLRHQLLNIIYNCFDDEEKTIDRIIAAVISNFTNTSDDIEALAKRLDVKLLDNPDIMNQWDQWRGWIADGDRSSLPRDCFEALLDWLDDEREEAATALRRLAEPGIWGRMAANASKRAREAERRATAAEARVAVLEDRLGRTANEFESYCNDMGNAQDSYQRDMIAKARAALSEGGCDTLTGNKS